MLESLKELSDRICAEMGLDKHDDPQILAAILATALAEARAEGRRQGLEEAAMVVGPTGPRPCDCERWQCGCGNPGDTAQVVNWDAAQDAAQTIRSLATAPAETQKPETGESDR